MKKYRQSILYFQKKSKIWHSIWSKNNSKNYKDSDESLEYQTTQKQKFLNSFGSDINEVKYQKPVQDEIEFYQDENPVSIKYENQSSGDKLAQYASKDQSFMKVSFKNDWDKSYS